MRLALPTTIWYLVVLLFCRCSVLSSHLRTKAYTVDFLTSCIKVNGVTNNFKFVFLKGYLAGSRVIRWDINVIFIIRHCRHRLLQQSQLDSSTARSFAKGYQIMMSMPYFLSWVVVSALVWAFLSYDKGLINGMLVLNGTSVVVYEVVGCGFRSWYL